MSWQDLMDRAYDKWQDNKGWSYGEFLSNLGSLERKAVVLGNFNHQVLNGGVEQWVENGYASGSGKELLGILADMGTSRSRIVRGIVVSVLVHVDLSVDKGSPFANYWLGDPEDYLGEFEELTNNYYELYDGEDGFVMEVEEYLRNSVGV